MAKWKKRFKSLRVCDVKYNKKHSNSSGIRPSTRNTRVYMFPDDKVLSLIRVEFGDTRGAGVRAYRDIMPEALMVGLGFKEVCGIEWRWSSRAGCSCGCSPGFILNKDLGGDLYVWLTVN